MRSILKRILPTMILLLLAATVSWGVSFAMRPTRAASPNLVTGPIAAAVKPASVQLDDEWPTRTNPYGQSYGLKVIPPVMAMQGLLKFDIDAYLWLGHMGGKIPDMCKQVRLKVEIFDPDDPEGEGKPLVVDYSDAVAVPVMRKYYERVPFAVALPPGKYPVQVSLEGIEPFMIRTPDGQIISETATFGHAWKVFEVL